MSHWSEKLNRDCDPIHFLLATGSIQFLVIHYFLITDSEEVNSDCDSNHFPLATGPIKFQVIHVSESRLRKVNR